MAFVLVIDDEVGFRTMVRKCLEQAGHTVLEAFDGECGLRLFREHSPDVVITDIFMPNKDGIETTRELRKLHPEVGILAVSGGRLGGLDLLGVAKKLGATKALGKPFRPADLLTAVAEMMPCSQPKGQSCSKAA